MGNFYVFIMNLKTSSRNSKWPIEYGGQIAKNYSTLMQIGITGVLELLITRGVRVEHSIGSARVG